MVPTFLRQLLVVALISACFVTMASAQPIVHCDLTATPASTASEQRNTSTPVWDPTPTRSLPTQDPAEADRFEAIAGVEDAVARSYVVSNERELWMQFVVADFDSPEHAQAAIPVFVDRVEELESENVDMISTRDVIDIPVPAGFDCATADLYIHTTPGEGADYSLSIVTATRGDRFYSFESASLDEGFDDGIVDILVQVVLDPESREQADGELTHGLWGELPIKAELPDAFHGAPQIDEYVPRSFGPIPPEG